VVCEQVFQSPVYFLKSQMEIDVQSAMVFPTGIDEVSYDLGGERCADGLAAEPSTIKYACKEALRPVASMLFFAIPKLLGSNYVTQSYVALGLNLLLILLCAYSLKSAFYPYQAAVEDRIAKNAAAYAGYASAFIVLFGTAVGKMSDLPSLAFFLLGISFCARALASAAPKRPNLFFLAGLSMAMAALLKPNYYLYGPFVLGVALVIDFLDRDRGANLRQYGTLINPIYAGIGLSFALLQCFWIMWHTGIFWPYEAANFVGVKTPHLWPFIGHGVPNASREMVLQGAAAVPTFSMVVPMDEISHALVKLYVGIFPQKLEPYSVFEQIFPPARWYPSKFELAGVLLASGLYLSYTTWATCFGPRPLRFINGISLFYALFTVAVSHTEYRYYLLPRLVLFATIIYYLSYATQTWLQRSTKWPYQKIKLSAG
jgi:hypothetical protein